MRLRRTMRTLPGKIWSSYNELANDLGNLVQRLATLCKKNSIAGQKVEKCPNHDFDSRMEKYEFNFAFDILWDGISELNKRIDAEKPWALAKTDPDKAKEVLIQLVVDLLAINDRLADISARRFSKDWRNLYG